MAEHGRSRAAPADTDVFCARHTHVGDSVRRDCFICYAGPSKEIETSIREEKRKKVRLERKEKLFCRQEKESYFSLFTIFTFQTTENS